MPTVFSTLKDAGGNPQGNVRIEIVLQSDPFGELPSPGFVGASDYDIVQSVDLKTDADTGQWSVDLAANADITYPGNTYYEVLEGRTSVNPRKSYRIVVPVGGGPYSVADILYEGTGEVGLAIQDEGTSLPTRNTLNFVGAAVTAVDDPVHNRTNVSVSMPASTDSFQWHYNVTNNGIVPALAGDSGAVLLAKAVANTPILQSLINFFGPGGGAELWFPPSLGWPLLKFTNPYPAVILKGHSNQTSFLDYYGTTSGDGFYNWGGLVDDWNSRPRRSGFETIAFRNKGGQPNSIAVKCRNVTHGIAHNGWFENFRGDGGAINASNFSDTTFWEPEFEYCGSVDGSNKAVVRFDGSQTSWAVDQQGIYRGRWEQCGDMLLHCLDGNGHYVGKIFLHACKMESGDQMGGTDCQVLLENAHVEFTNHDFTLQHLRTGVVTTIPSQVRLKGTCNVKFIGGKSDLGGDSDRKHFTSIVKVDDGGTSLKMIGFDVDSELTNAAFRPSQVVLALNTPTVGVSCCDYTGGSPLVGSKTAGTNPWISGLHNDVAVV